MALGLNKLKDIGQNKMIEGAERLNNHLQSFCDDIRALQEAFNNNTTVLINRMSTIEERLQVIEKKLDKILDQK